MGGGGGWAQSKKKKFPASQNPGKKKIRAASIDVKKIYSRSRALGGVGGGGGCGLIIFSGRPCTFKVLSDRFGLESSCRSVISTSKMSFLCFSSCYALVSEIL